MDEMRNTILSELIDKMHGRLADKMYPDPVAHNMDESPKEDSPAAGHIEAVDAPTGSDDDLSDDDIDEILKNC